MSAAPFGATSSGRHGQLLGSGFATAPAMLTWYFPKEQQSQEARKQYGLSDLVRDSVDDCRPCRRIDARNGPGPVQ